MAHPIEGLMATTLEQIKKMVDVDTIIGQPVTTEGGVTIIPVSKLSYGFASGGSDFGKQSKDLFGGGSGAGISIVPQAFLVVNGSDVKLLQMSTSNNTADKAVNLIPEVLEKISGMLKKDAKEEQPEKEKKQSGK
jgi:sporulation protein YtfJ